MKTSLKTILNITFLIYILPNTSCTQNHINYAGGWIIKNDIKIEGQILIENWTQNPVNIKFMSDSGQEEIYRCSQISAFGTTDGEHYYTTQNISISSLPFKNFNASNIKYFDGLAFLKVLKAGRIKLLHYSDNNSRDHFFIQKVQGLVERLVYDEKISMLNGKRQLNKSYHYQNQLKTLSLQCPKIRSKTNKVNYTISELTSFFDELYICNSWDTDYSVTYSKNSIQKGPLLIIGANKLNFNEETPWKGLPSEFKLKPFPAIGYFIRFDRGKVNVRNTVSFKAIYSYLSLNEMNPNFIEETPTFFNQVKEVSLAFHQISLKGSWQYHFYKVNKIKPYILINTGFIQIVKTKANDLTIERVFAGNSEENILDAYNSINNIRFLYGIGLGLDYQKALVEIIFDRDFGFSPSVLINDYNYLISLTIGYKI